MPLPLLFQPSSLRRAAPFYLAFLLLALSLLISLAGGWTLYALFRDAKEDELNRRLIAIGNAAMPAIAEEADILLATLREWEEADRLPATEVEWRDLLEQWKEWLRLPGLCALLENLRDQAHLTSVLLIHPSGRVLVDASGTVRPGSEAPLLEVDRFIWEPGLEQGQAVSLPYYELDGVPYKRVYIPLPKEAGGQVAGALRLEASLEASQEISAWRHTGLLLGGIVTCLMLGVALMFYRVLRFLSRMESQAAHRDRLEAMGLLTAGIAHEIRNPLGIIRTLAETLKESSGSEGPSREMLGDILGEVDRLNGLVNQYLLFARPDSEDAGDPADPAAVLEAVVTLVEKSRREGPAIRLELEKGLPALAMQSGALQQVLLNLLMNAVDASPVEKPVTVQARRIRQGSQVEIVVRDEGAGIAERDLRQVFHPFFTTKSRGSGLGLPISRQLARQCEGDLTLASVEGAGTRATLTLPVAK